jgi:hypothetical protein
MNPAQSAAAAAAAVRVLYAGQPQGTFDVVERAFAPNPAVGGRH